MNAEEYKNSINSLKGKTIAIVYNYPGDSQSGAKKYDFWEGDVIADWIHAVFELHGMPLMLDARTFVEKTMNRTLPLIDYVVNLSDGYSELSSSIMKLNSFSSTPAKLEISTFIVKSPD